MPLQSGARFGPYEVIAPLGAGGMGEVYRARDTRLDRSVALKVLPSEFAEDAQLRIRFEREAKAISQLEHPNICRLYDVGDGYLVMELLEGETLADRIRRGPLPVPEAVKIAIQIAQALDRAHRRGIVHRDLKPGNVMLTKSGAKLLDFGLARSIVVPDMNSQTHRFGAEESLTGRNVVLGTVAYMSPEQVTGQDLDGRSDLFSFGVVLQEMVSGRRPFAGASAIATMHAILETSPTPLEGDAFPPTLVNIINRCLEKDREDRFQSAADVAFALSTILTPSGSAAAVSSHRRSPLKTWALAGAALLVVTSAILTSWWWGRKARVPERSVRFQIVFPSNAPLASESIAISPDGSTLAYSRTIEGTNRLYLRSLSSLDDTMVEGSKDARAPFFSPDGTSIAFASEGKLKRLRLGEHDPVTIAEIRGITGGSWGADGTIVYASDTTGTLFRIGETGGTPREITVLDGARHETAHFAPQLLPDNHTVLFMSRVGFGTDSVVRVEAVDLRDGRRRTVYATTGKTPDIIQGFQWVDGVLLFASGERLQAVRLDPAQAAPADSPVTINSDAGPGFAFALSRDGTFVSATTAGPSQVVRIRPSGLVEPVPFAAGRYAFIALSPDERQLALTRMDRGNDVMETADLQRGTVSSFGPEGAAHIGVWAHDGSRLLYSWSDGGPSNVVSMRADGTGSPEPVAPSPNHQDPSCVSPDGRWLAYAERDPATSWDIWLVPLAGARVRRSYVKTPAAEYSPQISPDGRMVAYVERVRGGAPQVFVDSFPDPTHRTIVGYGQFPMWSADGKTLYAIVNGRVLAMPMSGAAPASPRVVADRLFVPTGFGLAPYAPMKDGSLLALQRTTDSTLTVVLHLTSELERLMKNGK